MCQPTGGKGGDIKNFEDKERKTQNVPRRLRGRRFSSKYLGKKSRDRETREMSVAWILGVIKHSYEESLHSKREVISGLGENNPPFREWKSTSAVKCHALTHEAQGEWG